jgi:hypothetical protein
MKLVLLLVALVVVAACQAASSGSPAPSRLDGVDGLVADFSAAGATVRPAGTFAADPLPGLGTLLCLGKQPVRVYTYSSAAERAQVGARIDPRDPSKVGTAIVEWTGSPRFWQRDRILVLYLGSDAATEALLTNLLGQPFARGAGGLAGLPTRDCA